MDWHKGFTSRYYVSVLDKNTRQDTGNRIEITGGTIKKTNSDVRESASLEIINSLIDNEQLIRVWMDARQDGKSVHTPLFTGWATSPSINISGKQMSQSLECYSVLKVAQDILLDRGWYAPTDADAVQIIKDLLRVTGASVQIKPDTLETEKILQYGVVAEQNETNLSMIDYLLGIIEWEMQLDGYGNIILGPIEKDAIAVFDSRDNDILEPKVTVDYDWFDCPNVFRAVLDNTVSIAKDEDPNSPLSIPSRGREIWIEETSCTLQENESLSAYAYRKLRELQAVNRSIKYDRRFNPDIYVGDYVRFNYPAQNIIGKFQITSQSIKLGYNATTSEEAVQAYE